MGHKEILSSNIYIFSLHDHKGKEIGNRKIVFAR